MHITVIGAGVVGLTTAYVLAETGCRVRVIADRATTDTVSSVAGAIWYPYAIDASDATVTQLIASRQRFEALADVAATGVGLREGLLVQREGSSQAWMLAVPEHPAVGAEDLPPGAMAGYRLTLPVIDTPRYLGWLAQAGESAGVRWATGTVSDIADVASDTDAIVVAAGLRSPALLGDDDLTYPVRGHVVRLQNPGLSRWIVDDDHPDGMTYIIPRTTDIVCGGTAEPSVWDTTWDADIEAGILRRSVALMPELEGLPVVSRAVGLRPARPRVRIEVLHRWAVPVVTCYGHGGAGVTASWGSASAVHDAISSL